jgi:hypothetical protein
MTDIPAYMRRHPDYAKGYEDGITGRPSRSGFGWNAEFYRRGLAAGREARRMFQDAGFTADESGSFTISGAIRRQP